MNLTWATNRRRRRPGDAQAAFSLVEVCMALLILGIMVTSLYAALAMAFGLLHRARLTQRTTQIMIEKMEVVRLYSWDQITDPLFWPKKFTAYQDPIGATNGNGGVEFKGTMSVKAGPSDVTYGDDMKTVTISIEWGEGKAKRTVEFVTYITKNGLQSYYF